MIIKWRTTPWRVEIDRVEILRETAKWVWFMDGDWKRETKARKEGTGTRYHDSWKEAHAFLLKRAERNLQYAKGALEDCSRSLKEVKGMKEPGAKA